jgi:hypothetical protein
MRKICRTEFYRQIYVPASHAVPTPYHIKYGVREMYSSQEMRLRLEKDVDRTIQKRDVAT